MFIVQLHFGRGIALTFASLRLPLLLALILSIIYKLRTKLIKEKNHVRNYESNTKYNWTMAGCFTGGNNAATQSPCRTFGSEENTLMQLRSR